MPENQKPWNNRLLMISAAGAIMLLVALLEHHVHHNVPLGLLYLFPMALIGTVTRRWEVPVAALLCTVVAEYSDAFLWNLTQGIPRDALYFIAYSAEGLYISEMLAKRRAEQIHVAELTREVAARREAEEQLYLLVSCSSVAIITADEDGNILQVNEAAVRLFGAANAPTDSLQGPISTLLPALSGASTMLSSSRSLRTMLQCQGFRADRKPFVADVWFSTYQTPLGIRMTAMVVDVSEEFRNREESNLEQILHSSRVVVGALMHEIRNVGAAAGLVSEGLATRNPQLSGSEDFQALRQLIATLERMTTTELSHVKREATPIRLSAVLEDLRVILASTDSPIEITWVISETLPVVWADQQGLLQVFLNLFRNADSAMRDVTAPRIEVKTIDRGTSIEIQVMDNGTGVSDPEHLFRPFETGSSGTGLGLYLSRAIMNSFRGDLRYASANPGACFIVELLVAA